MEARYRVWDKDLGKYLEGREIGSLMAELDAEDEEGDKGTEERE